MNQLLLGASIPFGIGLVIYLARGLRASLFSLLATPLAMALGMVWAVAPDLPRLWGDGKLYTKLSFDPRCDVFLWHYSIDKMETDSAWFYIGFVIVFASLLFAAWRELNRAETREIS